MGIKEFFVISGGMEILIDSGNGCDDRDDRDEDILVDASVLLKNVSSVLIPFASHFNAFILFLCLQVVVLEVPVYAALMLFVAFSFQWRASVISLFPVSSNFLKSSSVQSSTALLSVQIASSSVSTTSPPKKKKSFFS